MPKYYLYARKSTDDEDRQILSIESQLNELREYAQRENLFVMEEFIETKTAKKPGRPIFDFMLKQIEAGVADGILAWHPDRLARNSVDGGKIIYLVDIRKIADLRFPTFRFDTSAQGKFMLSIAFGQSKYYVDSLSENIKRGMREKLRRGIWPNWAPLGYLNNYKEHNIYPDPEKGPFVRKIFELYATDNYTLSSMVDEIARWGLVGSLGKPVRKSQVARLLRNPIYYGVFRFNGELYEASHPPLISKKLFDSVQVILDNRHRNHKPAEVKYAFTGLMRCEYCGCAITAEKQKGHIYYRCTKKKGPCLSKKFLREEALLPQINDAIKKVYIDDETKDKMVNRLKELFQEESKASSSLSQEVKNRVSEFDAKLERLVDIFIDRQITQEEYAKRKAKLLNDKKDLEGKLREIEKSGGGWLEPAKQFVTTCNQASSVAWQEILSPKKDFLKICGSNLKLKEISLLVSYKKPYDLVAKSQGCLNWRCSCDEIRNFYRQNLLNNQYPQLQA
jgi:DNA invertase Pin-like site-specific DNA recombinase